MKDLGPRATPFLEPLANDKDPEVAQSARYIVALGKLRGIVSGELFTTMPAEMDTLARRSSESAWVVAFLQASQVWRSRRPRYPGLSSGDIEPLLERAIPQANTPELKQALCSALEERAWELKKPVPGLLKLLADPDSEVRIGASQAIAASKGVWAVPALIAALKETRDLQERRKFVRALGWLGVPDAVPAVLPLLAEADWMLRVEAADALGALGVPDAIPQLVARLKDGEGRVRGSSLYALADLKARDSLPAVLPLLKDESAFARAAAVFAVGELGGKPEIPHAVGCLGDGDSLVRRYALAALRKLEARTEGGAIAKMLDHPDAQTKMAALELLGAFQVKESVPAILALLDSDAVQVRQDAGDALGTLDARERWKEVAKLLDSDLPGRRAGALHALGQLGEPSSFASLSAGLRDPEETVRAVATQVVGELRLKSCGPDLLRLLADKSARVRGCAALALARVSSEDAREPLTKLLREAGEEERPQVSEALCRLGSDGAARWLVQEARNGKEVSLSCLNALRFPALWKRWSDAPSGATIERFTGVPFPQLETAAGIPVIFVEETSDRAKSWLRTLKRSCGRNGRTSVILALDELLENSPYDFVLEPDRIRIVSRAESIRLWNRWLQEQGPRSSEK